jgi:hypothetical protein
MDFLGGREKMFGKLSLRNEAGLRLTSAALRALPLNGFERSEKEKQSLKKIDMERLHEKKINPAPFISQNKK